MGIEVNTAASRRITLLHEGQSLIDVTHESSEMRWAKAEQGQCTLSEFSSGIRTLRAWLSSGLSNDMHDVIPPSEASVVITLSRKTQRLAFIYNLGAQWAVDINLEDNTVVTQPFIGSTTTVGDGVGFVNLLDLALRWAQNKPIVQRPW